MLDDYEAYLSRRLAPTSVRLRIFWMRKFAEHFDLTLATEDDVYDHLESNPDWKPATRQSILASIRSFYRWAQDHGRIAHNPTADIPQIRVQPTPRPIASDEVIIAGIAVATVRDEAMLRLGAECGLRVSEIASLHHSCRDRDWLTVRGKGGKVRTLHLEPELMKALDVLERTEMRWGYYFPGRPHSHVAPSTVWRHVRALIEMNTHSLRHRAGTAVYRGSGYDIRLAQEFLGHSSPTTTAIYLHIEREQMVGAGASTRFAA